MVDVDDILRTAIEKDASDVHLISGIRPIILRQKIWLIYMIIS